MQLFHYLLFCKLHSFETPLYFMVDTCKTCFNWELYDFVSWLIEISSMVHVVFWTWQTLTWHWIL